MQNAVVGGFYVDGGDVVGKQDDFVGVDFAAVFFAQAVGGNDAALQEAGDECACAGKGVDDVHAFVFQAALKLALQDVFDAADNEINHFHGGVHDAEPFGHAGKGVAEKFVVQLNDDFLFAFGGFDAACPQVDGVVKRLQGVALFV